MILELNLDDHTIDVNNLMLYVGRNLDAPSANFVMGRLDALKSESRPGCVEVGNVIKALLSRKATKSIAYQICAFLANQFDVHLYKQSWHHKDALPEQCAVTVDAKPAQEQTHQSQVNTMLRYSAAADDHFAQPRLVALMVGGVRVSGKGVTLGAHATADNVAAWAAPVVPC